MPQSPALGLPEILEAVRRRLGLTALALAVIFIGVFIYAQLLPAQYTAKAIVALSPRPGGGASAVDVNQLGQKYVALVTAPATLRDLAPTVGIPAGTLEAAVSADVATSSVNLGISVRMRSRTLAARAANALADLVHQRSGTDELLAADVVSPALTPTVPSRPRRTLIEGIGLLVGLIISVAVAVVVERGSPRVRSASEVVFLTEHPVIGRIPNSRSVRGGVERAVADPLVGGAIRSLRTVLDLEARTSPIHTLVVTSSIPGEGKSTVASALASAIARLDARVLLMDADLRHPTVASLFAVPARPGLVEVLQGNAGLPEAVRSVEHVPGLSVLPTAGLAETGDLLARNLNAVLQRAAAIYDVVIVDSPPLLAADDAGTIVTLADGVLLVVGAGIQTVRLSEAARSLETLGARVIGAVLNRAPVASYGYTYRAERTSQADSLTTEGR